MKYSRSPWPGLSHARLGTDVPAPRLPYPQPCRGVCGRQGCGLRPWPSVSRPLPHSLGGAVVLWRSRHSRFASLECASPVVLPEAGGGGSRGGPALRCTARPCRCLSVPLRALCGAPGALQVVPHVPEAERWCHSLSQRAPLVPATVVCPVSSSLGGFQTVREACLSPPSVELGVTSSWSSSCGVPWGDWLRPGECHVYPFVGVAGGHGGDSGGPGPARGVLSRFSGVLPPPFKSPLDEPESSTGRSPALTVNTPVGRVLTHTAEAPVLCPVKDWRLVERLRGPEGKTMGGGRRTLGEKAFSSYPRGSLGVPDPPAAAPPKRSGHCGECQSTWTEPLAFPRWVHWPAVGPSTCFLKKKKRKKNRKKKIKNKRKTKKEMKYIRIY